jgi:hypothetical protein
VILLQTIVGTWFPGQFMTSDHRRNDGRADNSAAFVDDEATIRIAVEDQSKISCPVSDGGLRVTEVLRLERVGRVVGKAAIQLGEQADQLKIITVEHGWEV